MRRKYSPDPVSPGLEIQSHIKNPLRVFLAGMTLLLSVAQALPQGESDIFLAPLAQGEAGWTLGPVQNISQNPGYDNQPAFYAPGVLLYSGTRKGQTDIARYDLQPGSLQWVTDTRGGSEYSPLKIPGREAVSAIRLDTSGLQRLYAYPLATGMPELLLEGLKVGYHTWFGEDRLVCTVLVEDRMDLVVVSLPDNSRYTYQKGVGRSLHRVPGTGRISFTAAAGGRAGVKWMDPLSGATGEIAQLPEGVQDYCWLPDGSLICGSGNRLLRLDPGPGATWETIWESGNSGIQTITRLAVSPDHRHLAFTAHPE